VKVCACCSVEKPLDAFYFRKDSGRYRNQCKSCWDAKGKQWAIENKARSNKIKAEWQKRNPDNLKARKARYRQRNPVGYRRWELENPEKKKQAGRSWAQRNKARMAKYAQDRRAAKLRATPKWADHDLMRDMYMEAEYMGLEIDHIVPLRSPLVCGLHWEGNLQAIPIPENRRKSNRYWPDMP
jgi:hypothetical protein